jgi:hypothetical protein
VDSSLIYLQFLLIYSVAELSSGANSAGVHIQTKIPPPPKLPIRVGVDNWGRGVEGVGV